MPIMLLQNKMYLFAAVFLQLFFCFGCAAAGPANDWRIRVGMHPVIELNGQMLNIDRDLVKKLNAASEGALAMADVALRDGAKGKWLVLRMPSRLRGDAGFCGAGHEDRLLMLRAVGKRVSATGEFVAQSCLSSISMDVDRLNDLIEMLTQDSVNGELTFEQSISSEAGSFRQEVKIRAEGKSLKVESRRLEDTE